MTCAGHCAREARLVSPGHDIVYCLFLLGNFGPRCVQDSKACRRTGPHFVLQRCHRAHWKFTVCCFGCTCRDPGSNREPWVLQSDTFPMVLLRSLKFLGDVWSSVRLRARHVPGTARRRTCASIFLLFCCPTCWEQLGLELHNSRPHIAHLPTTWVTTTC